MDFRVGEFLTKKRKGQAHTPEEIQQWIECYLKDKVTDYQMSAWLMAVCCRGLNQEETVALTKSMRFSGSQVPRSRVPAEYWIDKHSTGGVGDKTSLLLVPLVMSAAERVLPNGAIRIPMISGRGLGHTGGTLDKLEAVAVFNPRLSLEKASKLLESEHFFMMGQTEDLAPADRRIYALRDATSTVECVELIVASILSKKLCESLDGLVMDIKFGEGAFFKTDQEIERFSQLVSEVGKAAGLEVVGVLSNMNEPLGFFAGHSVEVMECYDFLSGGVQERGLKEVTWELGAKMLRLASRDTLSLDAAKGALEEEVVSGRALQLFERMFRNQGGDLDRFLRSREKATEKLLTYTFVSPIDGYLASVKPSTLGWLLGYMGGGRQRVEDSVDHEVGFRFVRKVGDRVKKDEELVKVYYRSSEQLKRIQEDLFKSIEVSASVVSQTQWVREV